MYAAPRFQTIPYITSGGLVRPLRQDVCRQRG